MLLNIYQALISLVYFIHWLQIVLRGPKSEFPFILMGMDNNHAFFSSVLFSLNGKKNHFQDSFTGRQQFYEVSP